MTNKTDATDALRSVIRHALTGYGDGRTPVSMMVAVQRVAVAVACADACDGLLVRDGGAVSMVARYVTEAVLPFASAHAQSVVAGELARDVQSVAREATDDPHGDERYDTVTLARALDGYAFVAL